MLFFVAAVCVRWQLPAVAPGQVSVSELGRMEKGDCALLPFDASGGAFFVTPNNYSVSMDTNRLGYTKGGYNVWYGYNGTTQGLFTLGDEPSRVFVCAEKSTELRIVGCYLGDNGFDVISPGTGKIEKETLSKRRIGYILVDTNATMSLNISTTKGEVKVRVTDRNDHTTVYSGAVPEAEYPYGSAAFVDIEVVEDFEGSLSISFGDTSNPLFPDTKPSDADRTPQVHAKLDTIDLLRQNPLHSDTYIQIPMSLVFIASFVGIGILGVAYLICVPCPWIWIAEDEYVTLQGKIHKPKAE